MATPINRIKIQEKDLTSAGFSAAATDIAYVPGLSALDDQIVFNVPGITPNDSFIGGYTPNTSKTFINAADEVSWVYENGAWVETSSYVEPHPENVPVLCETVAEFEAMFGKQPYVFDTQVDFPKYGEKVEVQNFEPIITADTVNKDNNDIAFKLGTGETGMTDAVNFRTFTQQTTAFADDISSIEEVIADTNLGSIEDFVYSATFNSVEYKCVGKVCFDATTMYVPSYTTAEDGTTVCTGRLVTLEDDVTSIALEDGEEKNVLTVAISSNEFCGMAFTADKAVYCVSLPNPGSSELTIASIKNIVYSSSKVGGFTGAAYSVASMYKSGTPDLSYVYAKTLIKLGLPVLYENITVRDNVFPKKADSSTTSENIETFIDNNEEYIIRVDGVVQCTGELDTHAHVLVANLYNVLAGDTAGFANLKDKGEYTVKYITSGGYPTFEYDTYIEDKVAGYNAIAQKMINVAAERGDSVAIIDHTNKPERPLGANNTASVFNALVGGNDGEGKYKITASAEFGTMFTPWALYSGLPISWEIAGTNQNSAILPASFGYLVALAKSIKTNANWLAIAGAARGQVPYINSLNTLERLSNTIADSYQSRDDVASLNAITNIKPYGLTIWGNRTLKNNAAKENLTATSFLNLRNLVSDIKKTLYTACKSLLFEQNNDVLWVNFKMKVTPLLDQMQSGAGISGYKLIKGSTSEKAKLVATVKIFPVYAIEEFDVTVEISDQEVSVS